MHSISNKEIRTEDILWAGEDGDTKMLAIEHELTTPEALVEVQITWNNLTVKLEQEWTAQRVKDWWRKRKEEMLAVLRHTYSDCTKRITDIELENRDARVKGQSYKERQAITTRIKKVKDYRTSLKDIADNLKKSELPSYNILDHVQIEEMDIIDSKGVEYLLDKKFPYTNYI